MVSHYSTRNGFSAVLGGIAWLLALKSIIEWVDSLDSGSDCLDYHNCNNYLIAYGNRASLTEIQNTS